MNKQTNQSIRPSCLELLHGEWVHQKKTSGTRRRSESACIRQVHDNVMIMMYTSTRLHKHLPSNVLAQ